MLTLNFTAKDLIKGLLNTDPDKRLAIDRVLKHPWISQHTAVPQTPLCTQGILREETENWVDVQVNAELLMDFGVAVLLCSLTVCDDYGTETVAAIYWQ